MHQNYTLYQFNRLSAPEKYALLEDHGIHLEVSRLEGPHKVALFELYGFYVEVWLHQSKDELVNAFAFSSYKKLDPFLKEINLTPIYAAL